MPPSSNMRRGGTTTATITHINDLNLAPRRTNSGRAIRANTTRPTNYYARPFGSFSAAALANQQEDLHDDTPAGFYPAIQYFSDAITALPKEVMRQFTLMKEVEAKIHGPNEHIGEMIETLLQQPVPSRKDAQTTIGAAKGVLSLTTNNSTSGSANASVVNGIVPNTGHHSTQNSVSGSLDGEDVVPKEAEEELRRRNQYLDLRMHLHNSLANLDEKNGLLAEANRVLSQQLSRIDSVMPYVENELSEEARLGSMTHWAYSDNRQKKHVGDTAANRRNVAATNSLAAAANAVHETELQQARRDAVREVTREKGSRRGREVDSDFDDKPKKGPGKTAKSKAAANPGVSGVGPSNGEPVKKRKLDKGLAAPGMERSLSAATKAARAAKETPRSTPADEPVKKTKAKPGPLPKRKAIHSAQASPALASSPLQSSFNLTGVEPASQARPQSARARQNSVATTLRHENIIEEESSRRPSTAEKPNGEKINGKRKLEDITKPPVVDPEVIPQPLETTEASKDQDIEMADNNQATVSRSTSNSGKAGRGSKNGTPRNEAFPDAPSMLRTRSARNVRSVGGEESPVEPHASAPPRHRREPSNSHLVKQLAPFNRSPDLDRHLKDPDGDLESSEADHDASSGRSPRKRPASRRNTTSNSAPPTSAMAFPPIPSPIEKLEERKVEEVEEEPEQIEPELALPSPRRTREIVLPPLEASPPELEDDEELEEGDEEGSEPGDPDDPNEPKYCYCNRGSYGEMVACDNEACPREWFHLGCTELTQAPDEAETWYCAQCRPLFVRPRKAGRQSRGGR